MTELFEFERDLTGYTLESPGGNLYKMRAPIALGSQAVVYVGFQINTDGSPGEEYALKAYRSEFGPVETEAAHLTALKGQPNIVQMIEWAESMRAWNGSEECEGSVLVTTLADCSLETLTGEENLRLERTLGLLGDAAIGLAGAHEAGITHRDVKQDNLLLTDSPHGEKVELGDFGVAVSEKVPTTMPLISAFSHASPQTLLNGSASQSSDRYALAVVAYELISDGYSPFEPSEQTWEEALKRDATIRQLRKWQELHESSDRRVRPFSVSDPVYKRLYQVLVQALAVRTEDRFSTVLDQQTALMSAYHQGMDEMPTIIV